MFQMPMSSPMITTMLGLLFCAAAGSAVSVKPKPATTAAIVFMMVVICFMPRSPLVTGLAHSQMSPCTSYAPSPAFAMGDTPGKILLLDLREMAPRCAVVRALRRCHVGPGCACQVVAPHNRRENCD